MRPSGQIDLREALRLAASLSSPVARSRDRPSPRHWLGAVHEATLARDAGELERIVGSELPAALAEAMIRLGETTSFAATHPQQPDAFWTEALAASIETTQAALSHALRVLTVAEGWQRRPELPRLAEITDQAQALQLVASHDAPRPAIAEVLGLALRELVRPAIALIDGLTARRSHDLLLPFVRDRTLDALSQTMAVWLCFETSTPVLLQVIGPSGAQNPSFHESHHEGLGLSFRN